MRAGAGSGVWQSGKLPNGQCGLIPRSSLSLTSAGIPSLQHPPPLHGMRALMIAWHAHTDTVCESAIRDMVIPDTTLERKAASAKGGTHFVEPRASLSHLTHVVMPQNANVLGITFGGQVSHCRPVWHDADCVHSWLFALIESNLLCAGAVVGGAGSVPLRHASQLFWAHVDSCHGCGQLQGAHQSGRHSVLHRCGASHGAWPLPPPQFCAAIQSAGS